MNIRLRITIGLALAVVILVMATGVVMAQDSSALARGLLQPQEARVVLASWENAHPLEFYLALPVTDYIAMARTPSLANVHPLEYYLAFPIGSQVVQEQYGGMPELAMEAGE